MEAVKLIEIKEDIMSDNKIHADDLRKQLKAEKTFLMNLMASPGAGKTSFILKTMETIRNDLKVGVMEADIDSKVDAEKMVAQGIYAVQLRTGGFCHLDSNMVAKGLAGMETEDLDMVIIENVGNLVCPAEFDTGSAKNVMILSVPEGDDKPLKYPLMFTVADVMIIHKTDYLFMSDFDVKLARERALSLNPDIQIFEVSSKTGEGIEAWTDWLLNEVKTYNAD